MLVILKLWSFTFIYVTTFVIISFVCPAILMKLQEFKKYTFYNSGLEITCRKIEILAVYIQ